MPTHSIKNAIAGDLVEHVAEVDKERSPRCLLRDDRAKAVDSDFDATFGAHRELEAVEFRAESGHAAGKQQIPGNVTDSLEEGDRTRRTIARVW